MRSHCARTGESHCKCLEKKSEIPQIKVDLKGSVRKLFTDHAVYTALVLKAIISGTQDLQILVARLLLNQKDIGDQLKPIIGDMRGNQLTMLLTEHINLAAATITSAAKNSPTLQQDIDNLYDNSDRVAGFLTSLNEEKLPYEATQKMFHTHNQYVIDMAVARIAGNYSDEQRLYDSYYNEMLEMADSITAAL